MTAEDVVKVCRDATKAQIIAVHMEAINHGIESSIYSNGWGNVNILKIIKTKRKIPLSLICFTHKMIWLLLEEQVHL